jgi:PAS domain S-box-containing protein
LFEIVPDALVAVDAEGAIVQVNTLTEYLFGYKREELIGQKIETLVPDRYRPAHREHRSDFDANPKVRRMGAGLELYARRKDGTEFPVEISLSPVRNGDGNLVLSAIRDISDQKRIQHQLQQAHEELNRRKDQQLWEYRSRLAAIIDSSEDAIIGKDLNGIIVSWNRGAERIYGYTPEEMIGSSITTLIPKERPDEIPSILAKVRRGESIEHYESVRVAKDGRHLNVSVSISPIRDSEGKIVGASAIARNITAQKRAEEQLRQAQKMEAIGRLAGGVAHDFNNILGIISACNDLLRSRMEPNDARMQYLDNIRKASERGANLTRQLLAFSRKQTVQPKIIDLNERLREVTRLLQPLMRDDVEIVTLSRASSALIEVDPGQFDQIVLNLAVNARDAMVQGGKLIIEVAAAQFDSALSQQHQPMVPGKYVQLAVSDTGSGMDEATRARIFEPFFTTKEVGKGTGLGLATVYGIVQQSGGYIWVYSEPGRGTTFKVYFPSAEHKLGIEPEPEAPSVIPARGDATILIVEDDDLMRSLTRQMLEEHGYTVVEASDGKAALERIAENDGQIRLVLTDVVMRNMSGPELASRLTQTHPELRVVYMSGYTGELLGEHESLFEVALLEKPFSRESLLKTVHAALA